MSGLNIAATEHRHSNLQNTDPILAAVNSYDKYLSIERNKIRHKIRHSVSEKPILTKLLKSLII